MLDIKFVRENPDAVKENIKKKFQDAKLPLVDEVVEKDAKYRECLKEVESLKAARNKLSKANGPLFGQLKKCTDEAQKAELQKQIERALEAFDFIRRYIFHNQINAANGRLASIFKSHITPLLK